MSPNPCVHCGRPWADPVVDIDHTADCAMVTNVYPVDDDVWGCVQCWHRFEPDESYTTVAMPDETGHVDDAILSVLCLSCASVAVLS